MIFGQSQIFSVEAACVEIRNKHPLGTFCLHIASKLIGALDDLVDLSNSARSVKLFLNAAHRRARPDLDNASTAEVFDVLYGHYTVPLADLKRTDAGNLLVNRNKVQRASAIKPWDRDPYLLDDIGESSIRDKYTILVLGRSDGYDRVVIKSYIDGSLSEILTMRGLIDTSLRDYCSWVDALC